MHPFEPNITPYKQRLQSETLLIIIIMQIS